MIELFKNTLSKKGKFYILIASLACTLSGLLSAFIIYCIIQNIFQIETFTGISSIMNFGLFLFGLVFVKMICALIADLANHFAGFDIEICIREKIVYKLKKLSLSFYTQERLGDVRLVVHEDVQNLQAILGHALSGIISDILVASLVGCFLFKQSSSLTVAMISSLPIALLLLVLGYKRNSNIQNKTSTSLFNMVSQFIEYIKGIPLLRAYGGNSSFEKNLNKSVESFSENAAEQAKSTAITVGLFSVFFELAFGVMILVGVILIMNHSLTIPTFLLFVILSKEFYKPFKKSASNWLEYVSAKDSYKRIESILNTPVILAPSHPIVPTSFDVEFDNVNFKYVKDEFALKEISFKLPQNSITALVGSSGSGKTTITNLLLRFYEPQSGAIRIGGENVINMDYDILLKNISIIMQNVILFSGSIEDNIKIGKANSSYDEIVESAKKAQIHDFIISLPDGYKTIIGENGVGLSGGQKQRISIARAFLKDAPILLLDEITSNIDPINELKIQLAINELAKQRTTLVVAHNLKTIQNADNIIVLDKGELIEQGNHPQLLNQHSLYSKLWNMQYD